MMGIPLVAAFGAALLFADKVRFIGDGTCPAAIEVARAYLSLNDDAAAGTRPDDREMTVVIEPRGDVAVIRLPSEDGGAAREKTLPAGMVCAERAKAAAVIVAIHLNENAFTTSTMDDTTVPARLSAARTAVQGDGGRADASEGPATDEIELGVQGSRSGADLASGGRLGFAHTFGSGAQVRTAGTTMGRQRIAVAGGWATWTRLMLGVGYARRLPGPEGAGFLDLGADLLLARLALGSEGFQRSESSAAFHPGVAIGARYGQRIVRSFGLAATAGATVWPRTQRVFLRDVAQTATLPQIELTATLALFWSIR